MESIGYYHYQLAYYFQEEGIKVSVENPLSVKYFIQMKLSKVKTDKSDAKAICEYGRINEIPLYTALTNVQSECLQLALIAVLNKLIKQPFAIAKSGLLYDETYVSVLSK